MHLNNDLHSYNTKNKKYSLSTIVVHNFETAYTKKDIGGRGRGTFSAKIMLTAMLYE